LGDPLTARGFFRGFWQRAQKKLRHQAFNTDFAVAADDFDAPSDEWLQLFCCEM
jgi:hypothetical protein